MVVAIVCILTFLTNMGMSLMGPFYPLEVKDHGIDVVYVGFVIGTNAVFFIITCAISGKIMTIFSRDSMIIGSMLMLIVQHIALAYLNFVQD